MEKMISCCGINCAVCGAYIATKNNDDELRKKTAEEWSKMFNAEIDPATVNCEGCTSTGGILFQHCTVCEVRKCVMEKELKNCAGCDDYTCDIVENILSMAPEARENLEAIRAAN